MFFDNLTVKYITGPLVQEQSYYPFGLAMAAISDKALLKTATKEKFNAGNELEEGINYYNTFYRKYDPQLGRFTGVDIEAEQFAGINPYQFAGNNPVSFNDPMGDKYMDANGNVWHRADPLAGTSSAGLWLGGEGGDYFGDGSGGNFGGGGGGYNFTSAQVESIVRYLWAGTGRVVNSVSQNGNGFNVHFYDEAPNSTGSDNTLDGLVVGNKTFTNNQIGSLFGGYRNKSRSEGFYTVINYTKSTIWLQPEDGSAPKSLAPGTSTTTRIDGLTHPNYPGQIYKVRAAFDVTFGVEATEKGITVGGTNLFWPLPQDTNELFGGGWKSPPFGSGYFDKLFEKAGYKKP